MPNRSYRPDRTGTVRAFTLPEVLIASVVLAFAVAAISQAIVAGQMQTDDALRQERALSLAEALMEEILSKNYADPEGDPDTGPDDGETSRSAYDNADDFHGFSQSAGSITDVAGNSYPTVFQRYNRSVVASYTTQTIGELGGTINGLTVTITVTDAQGRSWSIVRFIPEPAEG